MNYASSKGFCMKNSYCVSVIIQIIVKALMRRPKQVSLSSFINDRTQIHNKKLSLSSKNVTIIDQLNPYICSETQSLNLQNNRLTSLKGIEQFTFLKELNISENKIQNCQELIRLKELYHLKKLYLRNNPFLNQPITPEILDIILEKETDIEILSFEILSTLKDVEEKEIKIIFLKNYIKKIDMHEQLKNKKKVIHQKTTMQTEELLNKIVPQFYTLIQDPKLINKIKREAIDKKKQSQESIEEVLNDAKHQKQEKIDSLIKDIVGLLHQNDQFKKSRSFVLQVNLNENTITFSPERKKEISDYNLSIQSHEYSPVKYIEVSNNDGSIEDLTLINPKQFGMANENINIRNFSQRINESTLPIYNSTASQAKSDLDNLQTARKSSTIKSISQKFKQHSQFKQSYQSQIKKIKERQESQSKKASQIHVQMKQSYTTPLKTFDMSKVKKSVTSSMIGNYIKVIEQHQEESQQNKSSLLEKEAINQQSNTFKTYRIQSSNISYGSSMINQNMTPQNIETIYFKSLSKINPMFSLLHSPSNSLKDQQKSEILQALKIDHKQKFIELLKERLSNQQLMRENEQLRSNHAQEIQNIIANNKNIYNQYLTYKEQFQWMDQRQKATEQKNGELMRMLNEVEANDKKKGTALAIIENNYKKLKLAYSQKHERIIFLENANEKQEIIKQKRQTNIMGKYIKRLNSRAVIWSKILNKNVQNKAKREKELLIWGMESFIFNKKQECSIKKQIKIHQLKILRDHFREWKICKELEKMEKAIMKLMLKKRSQETLGLLKKNQASMKMKKLKEIWAQRLLSSKRYKKSMKIWKELRQKSLDNCLKSTAYLKQNTQRNIFNALNQIVVNRKNYIDFISNKRSNRLFSQQFKRMIYIMRKETIQILQKQRKVNVLRETLQRKTYLRNFLTHARENKSFQQRKVKVKKYITNKNYQTFNKLQKYSQKKLNKFASFCYKLNFGVILKMIKREKISNDYSTHLLKRRWLGFFKNLRENRYQQSHFHKNQQKMALVSNSKLQFLKFKFIKRLEVLKLKGKNYVKHRKIQQMNHQMDLNDINTLDLVKTQKQEITRCQKQIVFLKGQIQGQSIREMALLHEKDQMMLSISQSYEIMMQLRRQVESMRQEYLDQEVKYNNLVNLYNQSITTLQKKQKEYERLYDTIREHKIK